MRTSLFLILASFVISFPSSASVRADQAWTWVEQGALLLDVRTPAEFDAGHLTHAINTPLAELEQQVKLIPRTQPIVVYCRSGQRSAHAEKLLHQFGFTRVHNGGGYLEMQR
ncbi:rhodanese-like domain-containing protein [Vibrio sp. SM6]|uniref:Rhodanese-like domain-containing protein n=1 Tax=Vibrio agarilyticus TaxID=2726741 RepID=A0A7X8TNJ3_9VIBR|nr:rhodanese-like domain-containing protein [Vibrio agarilyticus]NLS11884.1 rhodanese-like domain-containing protein [Vibrio agarilyticus]